MLVAQAEPRIAHTRGTYFSKKESSNSFRAAEGENAKATLQNAWPASPAAPLSSAIVVAAAVSIVGAVATCAAASCTAGSSEGAPTTAREAAVKIAASPTDALANTEEQINVAEAADPHAGHGADAPNSVAGKMRRGCIAGRCSDGQKF